MDLRTLFEALPAGYTPAQGYADLHSLTSAVLGGIEGEYRNALRHPAFMAFELAVEMGQEQHVDLLNDPMIDGEAVRAAGAIASQYILALSHLSRRFQLTPYGMQMREASSLASLLSAWVTHLA